MISFFFLNFWNYFFPAVKEEKKCLQNYFFFSPVFRDKNKNKLDKLSWQPLIFPHKTYFAHLFHRWKIKQGNWMDHSGKTFFTLKVVKTGESKSSWFFIYFFTCPSGLLYVSRFKLGLVRRRPLIRTAVWSEPQKMDWQPGAFSEDSEDVAWSSC